MGIICAQDPNDGIIYQVPAPRPPRTFEEIYGEAGYVLVEDCPPVPEQGRGNDTPERPVALSALIRDAVTAGNVDDE